MISVDEMRKELAEYCYSKYDCFACYLGGDKCRCGRGASFPKGLGMTDDEIVAAYDILVEEGELDPYSDSLFQIPKDIDFASLLCL